jgi:TonB family protein
MSAPRVTVELAAIQRRTRHFLIASTIFHALILVYFAWEKVVSPGDEYLTEVTWLEADEIASVIADATETYRASVVEAPDPVEQHFERQVARGDVAPVTQDIGVFEDKVSERLDALKQRATRRTRSMAALETPTPTRRPSLAAVSGAAPSERPHELVRGRASAPKPIELKRDPPRIQKAAVALPVTRKSTPPAEPTRHSEAVARRVLAGVSISGPVSDRPLVSYQKPTYPEWAKREAVEGSVNIYFVVQPDGTVKTNVMIQKTSGFEDFDRNATDALLAWRFKPLERGVTGEQWGSITFHYRLNHAIGN